VGGRRRRLLRGPAADPESDVPADHREDGDRGKGDESAVATDALVRDAHRRVQLVVRAGILGAEALGHLIAVEAERLRIGAHVADGERTGGQLVEPVRLERLEMPAPDARRLGDLVEAEAEALAGGLQRRADVEAGVKHRPARLTALAGATSASVNTPVSSGISPKTPRPCRVCDDMRPCTYARTAFLNASL
jgi:hypothetical protein